MVRTDVSIGGPRSVPDGSAASQAGHTASSQTSERRAYELTDSRGRRAYVWWDGGAAVVEADDPAVRRRVQRALNKPIWSREDVFDEFGVQGSTLVQLQPNDPRYANRLLWRWHQIGLGDLASVDVVTLPDRLSTHPAQPRPDCQG